MAAAAGRARTVSMAAAAGSARVASCGVRSHEVALSEHTDSSGSDADASALSAHAPGGADSSAATRTPSARVRHGARSARTARWMSAAAAATATTDGTAAAVHGPPAAEHPATFRGAAALERAAAASSVGSSAGSSVAGAGNVPASSVAAAVRSAPAEAAVQGASEWLHGARSVLRLLPLLLLVLPLLSAAGWSSVGQRSAVADGWSFTGRLSMPAAATTAARLAAAFGMGRATSGSSSSSSSGGGGGSDRGVAVRASSGDATLPPPPPLSKGGWDPDATVRVATVVPRGLASPYKTTWGELAAHTATRLGYVDSSFQMRVFHEEELEVAGSGARDALLAALRDGCQLLVGLALARPAAAAWLADPSGAASALPPSSVFLESSAELGALTRLQGGWTPASGSPRGPVASLLAKLPFTPQAADARAAALYGTLRELLLRRNSDDFLFVFLVLVNEYVTNVDAVSMTTKGIDVPSLYCMVTKCGRQITDCVGDPTCKAGLDCLQACSFNDQVWRRSWGAGFVEGQEIPHGYCLLTMSRRCNNNHLPQCSHSDPGSVVASLRVVSRTLPKASKWQLSLGWGSWTTRVWMACVDGMCGWPTAWWWWWCGVEVRLVSALNCAMGCASWMRGIIGLA
eukprot:356224-Chlamydomonas_euryale.AAC.2